MTEARTHPGKHAPLPTPGNYRPPSVASSVPSLVVDFHGDDGRTETFDVEVLAMPSWHEPVAEALALRIGPAGDRRTHSSATTVFSSVARLLRFLESLDNSPASPADLTVAHVEGFLTRVDTPRTVATCTAELSELRLLLRLPPLANHLDAEVLDHLSTPAGKGTFTSLTGYSDGEFARILDAARTDVAEIRSRITAGNDALTAMAASGVEPSTEFEHMVSRMAATGIVPVTGGRIVAHRHRRTAWAGQLFVTRDDLAPLLTLFVAVTGHNVEALKELPAEHRIVGNRAVEVRLSKRRNGPNRWHDTVTWEIGPSHRELHTPGGLYLLLHRLMEHGRALSDTAALWSSWRNTNHDRGTVAEHHNPFAQSLAGRFTFAKWSRLRELHTDADTAGHTAPLGLDMRRVRTSVEVRRTRSVGGHLPSAARSNSVEVLFSHYLRGDPTAKEWARQTMSEALRDAESAALAAHTHVLAEHGVTELEVRVDTAADETTAGEEGAWTACADSSAHPVTGRACRRVSFLDCFHCGNCVVTTAHLPAITALTSTLSTRRTELDEQTWWTRYGPTWTAIHHDIYPKFTAAQLDSAKTEAPECLLELAEDPWEHP
ncbi:hypothetical protein [Rhodococcus sp. 06-1460-1B]|uniref:hypothetical protein n=1 Tax=Rhodococcus sp. 06-1460-1B TaxID=2022501 RepID=UPI00113FEE36|nr:hypothetical protein [Rhodococcus sp. 06-1460-1B]